MKCSFTYDFHVFQFTQTFGWATDRHEMDRGMADDSWDEALVCRHRYSDGLLHALQSSMHEEETRNSLLRGIIYRAKHCLVPVQTTIGSFTRHCDIDILKKVTKIQKHKIIL